MELCRLCTNVADQTNAEMLFERNQHKLLRQVEVLIGQRLKKIKDLPQRICRKCKKQTIEAHSFRLRCIKAQQHFATQRLTEGRKQKRLQLIAEIQQIESETAIEEEQESNSDDALRLSHTAEADLSHESATNSENEDSNAADFNNDDDDVNVNGDNLNSLAECRQTTDNEEDMLNIESEISLATAEDNETPLANQIELAQHKKPYCRRHDNLICEVCGKYFKNSSGFKRHKLMHAGIRQFQCEQCPKNFMSKPELRVHMRNHTGEKPYVCSYCEHRFKDSTSRTIHERYHTNVRPFACDRCDKAFTKSSHLKRHIVAHTGERPYECLLCNVTFPFTKNLNQHFTTLKHKQSVEKQQKLLSQTTDANETIYEML